MTLTSEQSQRTAFWLTVHVIYAEYTNKPLLNLGFIFSLAIATSTLLSILILNDASKQQYQAANRQLESPISSYILPRKGQYITIKDYQYLRSLGFSQIRGEHRFKQTLANGKSMSIRAFDMLPLVLTTPKSYTSIKLNIGNKYAAELGISFDDNTSLLALADGKFIPTNINTNNRWGKVGVIDIALAWKVFPKIEGFTQLVVGPLSEQQQAHLVAALPEHLTLLETWSIGEQEGFAKALHLNLTALALLAFVVSLFIAFQAANQAWSKRAELAIQLRLLGVTLNIIFKALLFETLILTILACLSGMIIATCLVSVLLPLLGLTLEQLYNLQISEQMVWQNHYSLWAFCISAFAVIIALLKQFHVIRTVNVAIAARKRSTPFNFKISLFVALIFALFFYFWPENSWAQLMIKYSFILLASVAILPNVLTTFLLLFSTRLSSFRLGFIFKDASEQVARRYLPLAAFYLALTSSIAAALMINSFQHAFTSYLDQLLSADLFVKTQQKSKKALTAWFEQQESIEEYTLFQFTTAKYQQDTVTIYRLSSPRQRESMLLKSGTIVGFNQTSHVCYINEQLALKRSIKLEQMIKFEQPKNVILCQVKGIYHDYGNQGLAVKVSINKEINSLMSWQDTGYGLFISSGVEKLRQALLDTAFVNTNITPEQIYQSSDMKKLALKIFKQTFVLTQAIAFVLLSIACFGLFLSAHSLELARKTDLHILSSLGYSRFSLFKHMLVQWLVLAGSVTLFSWPIAVIIADALVGKILPVSFGWSMPLIFELGSFVGSSVIGLLILLPALAIPLYKLNIKTSL